MAKYKCKCGKMAVYYQMGSKDPIIACDDCIVPLDDKVGCSCNWRYSSPEGVEGKDWVWVEYKGDGDMNPITKEEGVWIKLDDRGRAYPCVEFDYDEEGHDIPTIFSRITWWFIITKFEIKNYGFKYYLKKWKIRW